MLLRLFKRSDKKRQDNLDIEKSTFGNSAPKGSGTSMDKNRTEEDESMSGTSVVQMPVEHIAESVTRIDDKNNPVQFGLDLTGQECQVSVCVDDMEKKVCDEPIDGLSTPCDTVKHLTSNGNKKSELCDFPSASSISESSDGNGLFPMPQMKNGSSLKAGDSVPDYSPSAQDFDAVGKMYNYPEGKTCGSAVTLLCESKKDSDTCESSTGDESDIEDIKKGSSVDEKFCGPIFLSKIGAGYSLDKCKSVSSLHDFIERKDGKGMLRRHVLWCSTDSVFASRKESSDDKRASAPGINSHESLFVVTKDAVIENLSGKNGKNEKSFKYKGRVNLTDEGSVAINNDSHGKCLSNITFTSVEPREGSHIRNGNELRIAKSNDFIPSQKKYIENEHTTCIEKNSRSSELRIKDEKDVSELCIEKRPSSEFIHASDNVGSDNTPNCNSEIPEKDCSTCIENRMSNSEIRRNVKEESGKASVKKKPRSRRKNCASESAALLASSVDSDKETEISLKHGMFTIYSSCDNCPHCTYSCLYNYSGKLCTIFGKQYIFTQLKGVPMLVSLNEEKFEVSMKNCCKILWREQAPLVLSHVEDGVEVIFDALLVPEMKKFSVLVIWHTRKPSVVTLPLKEYLMFMGEITGFQVQLVSLNAKETGVETGVLKATIDGQEETISFSAEVVFLNGAKVSNHADLLGFFQFPSTAIYITVNKFLHVGSRDKYVYISTCIWRGVKPSNLLLSPPLTQSKLYNSHGSGTLPQEQSHYSTLHCDVPCKLLFTEGAGVCALSSPGMNFNLKFVLDNKAQLIECPLDRFYCRNQHVVLISSRAHSSVGVKAHILKHRLEGNTEKFDVIMVQVPDEVVSFTLSESVSSLNSVQKLRVAEGMDSDRNRTSRVTNNLTKDESLGSSLKSSFASPSFLSHNAVFSNLSLSESNATVQGVLFHSNHACDVLSAKSQCHNTASSVKNSPSNYYNNLISNLQQHSLLNSKPEAASVKEDNPSSMNLWKSSNVVFDNTKIKSSTDSSQNRVDGLLSLAKNNTSISNLNNISESSRPSLASASKLCELSSSSKIQPAVFPSTPLSKNIDSSSFQLPLEIDIPNTSPAEYSNCSSSSLQYFSPILGSPMSSCSSYTSLSQVSSTKLTTKKTQPKTGNPSKQGTWSSGLLNMPNSSVQWSFGMPVNVNSKTGAESSESKVAVSMKPLTSYSQVVKKSPKPELPSNISVTNQSQNPPRIVSSAIGKSVEGSQAKENIYKALCTIKKIAPKSGIVMVRGNLQGVSYPKAFFLSKVLYVNGAPLMGGKVTVFKTLIEPLKNKEWTALLEERTPFNTSGVSVKYSARMMWVGTVPQPIFGEYQKMYKIISVVPLKQLKPSLETTASAPLVLPTKNVPAKPSPKPQPLLRTGIVVAVESTAGTLRSLGPNKLLGPNSKELQFTRNNCFLYNISLQNICLKNILPCGLEVIYLELNGKVKKVIVEGSGRDADLLDPATRYKLLKSWCEQFSVPIVTRDTLLVAGGWLPPELNPVAAQESKIAIVNLE